MMNSLQLSRHADHERVGKLILFLIAYGTEIEAKSLFI